MGTDHVIATASEAAQLQLNVFEPIIAYNLLNNLNLMRNGLDTLRVKVRIGPFPSPTLFAHTCLTLSFIYRSVSMASPRTKSGAPSS